MASTFFSRCLLDTLRCVLFGNKPELSVPAISSTVYLHGQPIAVIQPSTATISNIHLDRLGRRKVKSMLSPPKISKVRLQPADLVPIIQKRGDEQGANVAGPYSHYAYEQANLHLLAEDLFDMLARIVRAAKGAGVSQALLGEASVLLDRVIQNQY